MKLSFGSMTMELNVVNIGKQLVGFDDVEHHTLHYEGDFLCVCVCVCGGNRL